jgi:DtxR family Mn-dependent transcriptional regulator
LKFKKISLTVNQQTYLETIHDLCKEHKHAHTKAIAEKLNIKMASVTEAIRNLSEKGLVNYEVRKTITLTRKGKSLAEELEKRHNILADFFHNILGCAPKRSEEIACRVEHVIDEAFRKRLTEFAYFLKYEIPFKNGKDPIQEFQEKYNSQIESDGD